jgi:hypothetical protein
MSPDLVRLRGSIRLAARSSSRLRSSSDFRADPAIQAADRLDVVVEDLGDLIHDRSQRVMVALEIRREHLDGGPRRERPDGADRGGEHSGASVGEIVAIDGGHDGVAQPHGRHGLAHPARLIPVDVAAALAALHRAEGAGAGADVAEDHEGGGPVPPALGDVRAAGLLTDGVEILPAHDPLDLRVAVAGGKLDREPLRTPIDAFGKEPLMQRPGIGHENGPQADLVHGALSLYTLTAPQSPR